MIYYRYLIRFEAFLANIDRSHPGAKKLLANGGMVMVRFFTLGALSVVDKTIEGTFIKFVKSACKL